MGPFSVELRESFMDMEKQSILTMDQCAWELPLSSPFCGEERTLRDLAQGHRTQAINHSLSGRARSRDSHVTIRETMLQLSHHVMYF